MHGGMTSPGDRKTRSNPRDITSLVDAARSVAAARGISGMSLRTVAEEAETSVGSISYRIGDRAALIAAVLDREIELMARARREWGARVEGHDVLGSGLLADLVCEWLDEGAHGRRTSAIVTCELALLAAREPSALPAIALLFEEAEGLWRDILPSTPEGERVARFIACYCLDEQVFSIVLSDETDYRLLRHSTVRGMLRGGQGSGDPAGSRWHMALVERLAVPAAAALDESALPQQGTKSTIAEHIADLIVGQGVGVLSHRAVAQVAGVATSSVAHHFPTHRDILFAGVEAVYLRLRGQIRDTGARLGSGDIIRLTHECALAALTDPGFRPFAIDMRRRRAENVHAQYAGWLGVPVDSDRARVQALVVASIGNGLRSLATGADWLPGPDMVRLLTKGGTGVLI